MIRVKPSGLANAVMKELSDFESNTVDQVKKTVSKVAKETVEDIKGAAPSKTGKYKSNWKHKAGTGKNATSATRDVYNDKRYMVAHLLEHGHAKRGGGRTKALTHIAPAEGKIEERLIEELNKIL